MNIFPTIMLSFWFGILLAGNYASIVETNLRLSFYFHLIVISLGYILVFGPALHTRGNLARTRARGAGSPRTVKHRYLPGLWRYETLMMRAKE